MRKGFWVLILILLFIASAYLYKLNLEKEQAISEENNETDLIKNLDEFENIYFWIFGAVVAIIFLFIVFSLARRRTYS